MERNRLVAGHALALVSTITTITLAAVASAPHTEGGTRIRWVIIAIGAIAAASSIVFARNALREIDRLARALDASRLARGGDKGLRLEQVAAATVIRAAVVPLRAQATRREISLREDDMGGSIHCDPERLERALAVLIERAIAANAPGAGIAIDARETGEGVRFTITVTPAGALPDSVSAMFGVATTASTAWGASDQELQACTRTIEAHGGRLGFELAGARAICRFTLPGEPQMLR